MGEDSTPSVWKLLYRWRRALCSKDSQASTTERFVGIVLSLEMSAEGEGRGGVWVAKATALHPTTVRHALAGLVAQGWLKIAAKGGLKGQARVANTYRAVIPNGARDTTRSGKQPVAQDSQRGAQDGTKSPSLPSKTARPADPTAEAQRAQAAIRERNHLRAVGKACEKCGGSYWLDTEPPTRCPECAA